MQLLFTFLNSYSGLIKTTVNVVNLTYIIKLSPFVQFLEILLSTTNSHLCNESSNLQAVYKGN